jgi:predicted DNA-binding transcriptional regulator AlpA
MRLLDRQGLKEKGINYSATQLWRLMRAKKFPQQVKIGSKNAWVEQEIDDFIASRDSKENGMTPSGEAYAKIGVARAILADRFSTKRRGR